MYRGNFRVLIFIDLLATALGASILLMLILSVGKNKTAMPAGLARNYLIYEAIIENNNDAQLEILVKKPGGGKWETSVVNGQDLNDSVLIINNAEGSNIYSWGPAPLLDRGGRPLKGCENKNTYTVFSTTANEDEGYWTIAILYAHNKKLDMQQYAEISRSINILHRYKIRGMENYDTIRHEVSLGKYDFIDIAIKYKP